jgi:hypothetical protein
MPRRLLTALLLALFLTLAIAPALADTTVYITKTGKKYHIAGCHYLKQSKYPISLEEAKSKGYTPCYLCQPDATPEPPEDAAPPDDIPPPPDEQTPAAPGHPPQN